MDDTSGHEKRPQSWDELKTQSLSELVFRLDERLKARIEDFEALDEAVVKLTERMRTMDAGLQDLVNKLNPILAAAEHRAKRRFELSTGAWIGVFGAMALLIFVELGGPLIRHFIGIH